jgi:hypothetical protein
VNFERRQIPLVKCGRPANFKIQYETAPDVFAAAMIFFCRRRNFFRRRQPSNAVTTAPVYVPDYSHANEPLPGRFAWDARLGRHFARFVFNFTNTDGRHQQPGFSHQFQFFSFTNVFTGQRWSF